MGFVQVCLVLGFQRQLDCVLRVAEGGVGPERDVGKSVQDSVQHIGDVAFLRPQEYLQDKVRILAEHFLDALELSCQDFRDSGKYVDVLDSNDWKQHPSAGDQFGAFGDIGHPERSRSDALLVISPEDRLEFGTAFYAASEGRSDSGDRHIVVRRSNAAGGKHVVEALGELTHLVADRFEFIRNDRNPADIDAQITQLGKQIWSVFVPRPTGEDLVADDDDSRGFRHAMRQYTTSVKRPDARLIVASSDTNADMFWATRLFAPDPFIFIMKGRKRYLVMSDLEVDRARAQSTVDVVLPQSEYAARLGARGVEFPSTAHILCEVFADLAIGSVQVPASFPTALADSLRAMGVGVQPRPDPFWPQREIKTDSEVRAIRKSLRTAEAGMEAGIETIRRTKIGKDGYLYLDGTRFTSERLKSAINTTIMALGSVPSHTIAAAGPQSVDPHNEGSGPIRAHSPIIIDIFPRSQKTGYFGDMTRTVVRGRASERLKQAYAAVENAQKIGFRRIRHNADAYRIHKEILEYFEGEGFGTGARAGRMQGFFHGTGHGLGLDIHEAPAFGLRSRNRLKKNHVVTVEPGLYYSGMGGVRLEDVVVVTEAGCRNLVRYPKSLEI